jgi:hypothetical protein
MSALEPALQECPNCGQALCPAGARYCSHCGQEAHVRPPTLGEFAHQFGGSYISTEGALWRSLRLLLTRPGALTLEYWRGRRKHYVLPLRLYLTVSVIVLLLFRLIGQGMFQADTAFEASFKARAAKSGAFHILDNRVLGTIGSEHGVFVCARLPGWICAKARDKFGGELAVAAHQAAAAVGQTNRNIGQAMFLLLPLFALWTKLLYWKHRRFYTEHLVLALHVHTFGFLATLLNELPVPYIELLSLAIMSAYMLAALQRIFAGPFGMNLLRAAAIAVLHAGALLLMIQALVLWAVVG